jgi:hypothetical protein
MDIRIDGPPVLTATSPFWRRSRLVILTICGTLCALLWTLFFRRFGFRSRKAALRRGLIAFGLLYGLSGFFLLLGSYLETMSAIGLSLR